MAQLQNYTEEMAAHDLMVLLVDKHNRPGDLVNWQTVSLEFVKDPTRKGSDFKTATDYALRADIHWLEPGPNGGHALTEEGYDRGLDGRDWLKPDPYELAKKVTHIVHKRLGKHPGQTFSKLDVKRMWGNEDVRHQSVDIDSGVEFGLANKWWEEAQQGVYILNNKAEIPD